MRRASTFFLCAAAVIYPALVSVLSRCDKADASRTVRALSGHALSNEAALCDLISTTEWAVFLHTFPHTANDWQVILDDEVKTIHASPLYTCGAAARSAAALARTTAGIAGARFFYSFTRNVPWPYPADPAFTSYTESVLTKTLPMSEVVTQQALYEWCSSRPNAIAAYVHDKGSRISATDNPKRFFQHWDWRRLHEFFILERPEECLKQLLSGGFDACGVNFSPRPWRHYSGNFWWARCSHINELEPIITFAVGDRMAPERWVGSAQTRRSGARTRFYECFNSDIDHYFFPFPRSKYINASCTCIAPSWVWADLAKESEVVQVQKGARLRFGVPYGANLKNWIRHVVPENATITVSPTYFGGDPAPGEEKFLQILRPLAEEESNNYSTDCVHFMG
jgi:hypothetical protein